MSSWWRLGCWRPGARLMALHVPGVRPGGYRSGMPEVLQEAIEAYGYNRVRARTAPPQAREIAAMDQALSWIRLLPADRVVMRRIVGARMLCRPEQDRPLLGWRVIAARVGASHEAVRGWHAIALTMIVGRLNAPGLCAAAGGAVGPAPVDVARAMRRVVARRRVRELA